MEKINNKSKCLFIISIISSLLFVLGIPMIILGAVNDITIVMILGIIFTAINFYAIPLLWIRYATIQNYKRLIFCIVNENIYSVEQLSLHLSLNINETKKRIQYCFGKGYLIGYLFNGTNILLNDNINHKDKLIFVQCKNCGASYTFSKQEQGFCPYCNTLNLK